MADLIYLGLKHFRVPPEIARIAPTVFSDEQLRHLHVPTLLLMGDEEVIYDPAVALARAQQLLPMFEGALVTGCGHDMCFSRHRLVDRRIRDFLKATENGRGARAPELAMA